MSQWTGYSFIYLFILSHKFDSLAQIMKSDINNPEEYTSKRFLWLFSSESFFNSFSFSQIFFLLSLIYILYVQLKLLFSYEYSRHQVLFNSNYRLKPKILIFDSYSFYFNSIYSPCLKPFL